MADLTLLLQNNSLDGSWYSETTTASRRVGHNGIQYYAYYLKFKTPSFASSSRSKKVTFRLAVAKIPDSESTVSLRYAILKNLNNRDKYTKTINDVTDTNKVLSGTVSWSGLSASISVKEISINTTALASNTEYYLMLWSSVIANRCAAIQPIVSSYGTIETEVKSFTLTISQGANSTITVNRTDSPNQGAAKGNLSGGAVVYYGDKLKISFSAGEGYSIGTHTVNGTTFSSGSTHTVAAGVSVVSTANVIEYKLTISATNATVTVNRTDSPNKGAATGNLSNNAAIYYGDVLRITFSASAGYAVESAKVNSTNISSGALHIVKGNAAVEVTGKLQGAVYIGNEMYLCYVGNGSSWDQVIPYVYDSEWKICS